MSKLPEFDAHFDKLRADAAKENKVLRFVGIIDATAKTNPISAKLEK